MSATPQRPRSRSQSAMFGQVMDRLAALETGQGARDRRMDEVSKDTRETRDAVRELSTIYREQDLSTKIEGMRADVGVQVSALRQDAVAQLNQLKEIAAVLEDRVEALEREKLAVRIAALEEARQKLAGAGWLLQTVRDWGPSTLTVAVLLFYGVKEGLIG